MLHRMKRQGMMVLTAVCVEVSGRTLCSIDRLKKVQKKHVLGKQVMLGLLSRLSTHPNKDLNSLLLRCLPQNDKTVLRSRTTVALLNESWHLAIVFCLWRWNYYD